MNRKPHQAITLLARIAVISTLALSLSASLYSQATPTPLASLGDSLRHAGNKQLRIFYVHGMAANGPGDFDSWKLRKGICDFLRDCTSPAGELASVDFADQDEFALNAPPPALAFLGQPIWKTSASGISQISEEWNAAAPFVVHWKLARLNAPTIYVDEINWWPLVFALKCREIVASDAALVGPSKAYIRACAQPLEPATTPGRFTRYPWITAAEADRLETLPSHGALINRGLKNSLLDWGFSDAVLALGPLRPYLLDGIRQLILKSAALPPQPTAPSDQEFVIVSHSLGSYLIFSALDLTSTAATTPTAQKSKADLTQILAHTSIVYFFANQLRLLELANLDVRSTGNMVDHLEAWGQLRRHYLASLPSTDTERSSPPQIVAWTDPSDLLSWTVPDLRTVAVTNLSTKNARHWFWLFESPLKAHDNYALNKSVIREMLRTTPLLSPPITIPSPPPTESRTGSPN
jgi:hypothetical protein